MTVEGAAALGPELVVAPEQEVPADLRAQVLQLHREAWPPDDATPGAHDAALHPLSMLLVVDGRVLSALDILSKPLVHRGVSYAASGLSAVVTDPAVRRRGHGLRLVRAARARMAADGADLAIFTCALPLAGFYEQAGFEVLPGTQLLGGTPEDPLPSSRLGGVTLVALFTPRATMRRDDFLDADIELYPGTIDRLW